MTFFGNLIFAIIARMFCGNHLKLFKFSHETIKKLDHYHLYLLVSAENATVDSRLSLSFRFQGL